MTEPALVRRIWSEGRRRQSLCFDIAWVDNGAGHPRLGLIVPRFQSTAVARNRLRRRIQELWRREIRSELARGIDVTVRARRAAYRADFEQLRGELRSWLARSTQGGG